MKWKESHSTQTHIGFILDKRLNGRHTFRVSKLEDMIEGNVKMDELVKLENNMASKEDLKWMASKDDLKGMVSKEDLKGMDSKEDLIGMTKKKIFQN